MEFNARKPRTYGSRGVVALMSVIVIGALILLVGISASFIAQTEIILAGDADGAQAARTHANACLEEAFHRLKLDTGYTGGSVPIDAVETCTITVTGTGGARTVTVTGTSSIYTKTIQADVSFKQNALGNAVAWSIDSWQEVDP